MVTKKMATKEKKPNTGRRKIEIKKITNNAQLQVTFSKRKRGLFKKASELTVVCGAQVAIILFSPAGKCYVFGHPTPDHIIDRFLNNNHDPATDDISRIHEGDELYLCQQQYMEAQRELDAITKRGELGWDAYIDGLSLAELEKLRSDLEQLVKVRENEKRCDDEMKMSNATSCDDEMKISNATSSSWLVTVPDADGNAVGDADDGSFDFTLDGDLSNVASSSSWMTAPDSDVNGVAADDDSFNFYLDANPDDPIGFLDLDNVNLLEYECF